MSQASGMMAMPPIAYGRRSPTSTSEIDSPRRSATLTAVRAMFPTKRTNPPARTAKRLKMGALDGWGIAWVTKAPATAGSANPMWFAAVPYQGTRPLSSRPSVTPSIPTIAAAAGPPRYMTATNGPIEVLTTVPRAMVTGSADATSVTTIQKPSPSAVSTPTSDATPSRICVPMGTTTPVIRITRIPTITSVARYNLRVLDIHPREVVSASDASGHPTSRV